MKKAMISIGIMMDKTDKDQEEKDIDELYRTMMARAKYAGVDCSPGFDTSTTSGKIKVIEELKLYVGD